MYHSNVFQFPKLVYLSKGSTKDSKVPHSLYELSWGSSGKRTLPEPYDSWLMSQKYLISDLYLKEIRYMSFMSVIEKNRPIFFSKRIKEICNTPSFGYIYSAFSLIADCLFDSKTNDFMNDQEKIIAPYAMLYKFWMIQNKSFKIVKERSFLRNLDVFFSGDTSNEIRREVKTFLTSIEDFEQSNLNNIVAKTDVEKLSEFLCGSLKSLDIKDGLLITSTQAYPCNPIVFKWVNDKIMAYIHGLSNNNFEKVEKVLTVYGGHKIEAPIMNFTVLGVPPIIMEASIEKLIVSDKRE